MKIAGCAAVAVVLVLAVVAFAPSAIADDSGDKVIVTRPGVVFHKVGGDDIRGTGVAKSIDAALESGYTPCRVCFGKELGSMQVGSQRLAGGGRGAVLGQASVSIPAPPTSTVTQPFGIKFRVGDLDGKKVREAVRDPYQDLNTRNFAVESGAFETR